MVLEPGGKALVDGDVAMFCPRSAPCPFALRSPQPFPRRPCALPARRSRKAVATRACATSWARCSRADFLNFAEDARFAGLFPARGRPAEAPWRLALVTLFQFAEGLPDRQAAEAVRGRIDWKYALALPLTDPGFDSTVLSEFRSRLVEGGAEQVLLDMVLALAQRRDLLSGGGRQRTDATHVLATVRALIRSRQRCSPPSRAASALLCPLWKCLPWRLPARRHGRLPRDAATCPAVLCAVRSPSAWTAR